MQAEGTARARTLKKQGKVPVCQCFVCIFGFICCSHFSLWTRMMGLIKPKHDVVEKVGMEVLGPAH